MLCFSLWAWGAAARAATLSAGAAKASITPTVAHLGECVRLGGFGTYTFDRGCSTGVHADIHARARAVLDAPGIGNKVLDAPRSRASAATDYIDSRVVRPRLGDAASAVELVSLPGEATTRLGLDWRNLLAGAHEVLLGLDHDTLGYFLPRDEYGSGRNGGDEESVSLERDAGEEVRAAVQWLVQQ